VAGGHTHTHTHKGGDERLREEEHGRKWGREEIAR
jgi:hypothetical protein